MKKTTIILGALVMLLAAACSDSGYKKTKSGLMYKIISDGKGAVAKKGDVIKLHFKQKIGDSVHVSSYDQMPFYSQVDELSATYDPKEIFPLLRKGDSAVVIISGDTLFKRGALPQNLDRKDKIVLTFKVLNVFTVDSVAQNDRQAEGNKMQAKQAEEMVKKNAEAEKLKGPKIKEIEDYLATNKITCQKAPLGTYVDVKNPGTGPQAALGKKVFVRYTGKSFPSGKVFESNMDAGSQAYPVVIGAHGVIDGWEDALPFFKKGGTGTIYVPFFLAYGIRPGPGGQPFENLIFDIKIDDVQENIPEPQGQRPPGQ
jgi:FKBP-type peptidyl-prolyl cis-trans isomerase FkpA